ncbi:hypothetical protein MSS4_01423 [Mycobacterium marinum]|nr:hypothetical protein DE4381_02854 [Mycobacterium marinum]RFZ35998.1 hypothetical protein NCTC2275_01785 [Mycobacterium marinum]RFZ51989.1 hypothetical protein MSS4_01423 [Mycobacterium marinum]
MGICRCGRCSTRLPSASWRRVSVRVRGSGRRWWPVSVRRWFRCRLPSSGCGLSISCRGLRRSTTWRGRRGCPVSSMPRRWVRRLLMWWPVMRACGRCFVPWRGWLSSWCWASSRSMCGGRSSMLRVGRHGGWLRPSNSKHGIVLIWRSRFRCGRGCFVSLTTSTCWWWWLTISPLTGGRCGRWSLIWEWLMPVGVRGGRRVGRGWRCSMSITRCGSAPTWVS